MIQTRDLATGGIVAMLAIASAVYASRLPSELAVQFDSAGEPNSFVQAELFLAGDVLLAAGVAVLFAVLPRVDPLGENVTEFQTAYDWFAVGTVAFVGYIHGLVIAYNLGYEFGILEATVPATAAVYLLLGPLLYRAEQNWFVGIRTPWTLSNERVWKQTHRHTAPLFVLAGVLALGGVIVPEYAVLLMSVPPTVIAVGSILYSFVLYRRFEPA